MRMQSDSELLFSTKVSLDCINQCAQFDQADIINFTTITITITSAKQMHQSGTSYRSNRYPSESRSRIQQHPPAVSSFSSVPLHPVHHHNSPAPLSSLMQQQQIEELEQKVDMILLHNNQLIEENAELKRQIDMAAYREVNARYNSNGNSEQVKHIKWQLQAKQIQLEELSKKSILDKEDVRLHLDQLNQLIKQLSLTNQKQLLQIEQQGIKISTMADAQERQLNLLRKTLRQQYDNQIYESSLKKQIEHKEQLREREHEFEQILRSKKQEWDQQRAQLEQQKMNEIVKIQQKMKKDYEEQAKRLEEQIKYKIREIEKLAEDKIHKVRQQSQNYIKSMLEHHNQEQKSDEQLKKQIQILKQSLQQRQKLLQSVLSRQKSPSDSAHSNSYYNQVQELRQQIKLLTEQYLKESELLKVKMALKHDLDVRQTVKVYENKIQILSKHMAVLEDDKAHLREKYEDEIRSKMKQRQKFEVEVSKLKNYIRKMKIQLESYGKQMRLNIEGIRDQANSFSMSIIGQLGQQKNKKNFYEEEIRKMREIIELREHDMENIVKQCEQKIRFYEQKLKNAKKNNEQLAHQLEDRDESHRDEVDALKHNAKQDLKKQRKFWQQQSVQQKKQIQQLHKLNENQHQTIRQHQSQKSVMQKQLQRITRELESCKSHIDALKIEMQLMDSDKGDEQTRVLKAYYERIIGQLEQDKLVLKETNAKINEQLGKLMGKYQTLQKSMQKVMSTMKKRTELEQRVLVLGMDENLVKNLGQVFNRDASSSKSKDSAASASKQNK